MATIAGVECRDGALLVADRVRTRGGRILTRDADHLVDLGAVGAASVGGDPDRFADELDAAVRSYRLERGDPRIDAACRLAAEALGGDAAAVVAARDEEGRPRVRALDDGGTTPADPVAARGSGAAFVLGAVEGLAWDGSGEDAGSGKGGEDGGPPIDDAADALASAFAAAAERDPATGSDLDRYRLRAEE
ncbi:MAG: 20S proteasome subunit A/B [Haloferacaceae archaeon]